MPKHTVIQHPEFATHYGFIRPSSREKIASTFLNPTTFKEYCNNVKSPTVCYLGDDVAKRLPNPAEEDKFYIEGVYNGYFGETLESSCGNGTCVGHFINGPCDSKSRSESQMYHNMIPMVSNGSIPFIGGYNEDDAFDIWRAADATKSNVMLVWPSPSDFSAKFANTNSSFFRVQFPESTEECIDHQKKRTLKRCSSNETERVGADEFKELSKCDYPLERTVKVISSTLKKTYDTVQDAKRSPALDFMYTFKIELHSMQDILNEIDTIKNEVNEVGDGYAEREAVCRWVYSNLQRIELSIPKGFPREIEIEVNNALVHAAIVVASIAMVLILVVSILIFKYRHARAIRYAQVTFLAWMMGG